MTIIEKSKILYVKFILNFRILVINIFKKILFKKNDNPKRILIHRIGTFGDSIVSLPAINTIKQNYKFAELDFITTYKTSINLSTIIEKDFFNNIFLINKKDRKKELIKLKDNNYDLFIDLPQNYGLFKTIRNMLLVRFILNIRSAYGWDSGMVKAFAKEQIKYLPPKSERERFLNILENEYLKIYENDFPVLIDELSSKYTFDFTKTIAFVIGTNVQANMWPTENWIELAEKLVNNGFFIALIGGEQEKEKANFIVKKQKNILNFCGEFSVSQSAMFLKKCLLAVSHDTGAMHLSYAVGTPVIALFSTRQLFSKWLPPKNNSVSIYKIVDCSGCFFKDCKNNICMKNITVDEVYNEVVNIAKK